MFGIGLPELIVILILALIVLGPEKLPQVARQVAKFMNDLKKASEEFKQELELDKLEDIKNPVKLDNLLGEDLTTLKKNLTEPDFLAKTEKKTRQFDEPKNNTATIGGLGHEWHEAKGRGKKTEKTLETSGEEVTKEEKDSE